jgi:biotin operon repressor
MSRPMSNPKTFKERDDWMRDVLDTGDLSHLTARVATRIALHLHVESGRCNPGYEHLASSLGISKRSVIRHVAGLESAGWIKVERAGWRHPNNFVLLTPRG